MLSRRTFLSLVAGSMAAPELASAQPASQKVALYANVGADLTHSPLSLLQQQHRLYRSARRPGELLG
jgi:hypothetical protein